MKYTVITFLFNGYDKLRTPRIVDPNAVYVCFTDDPKLESHVWKCVYLEQFADNMLTGVQKTYRLKYSFWKYLPADARYTDWWVVMDGSLEIQESLGPVIMHLENNGYDMALSVHPDRTDWLKEYDAWIEQRAMDAGNKARFMEVMKDKLGTEDFNQGLVECTIRFYRANNQEILHMLSKTYELLNYANQFKDPNDQCYFTYICKPYIKRLKTLLFSRQLYFDSKYFRFYLHGTDRCIRWNGDPYKDMPPLAATKLGGEQSRIEVF